MRQVRTYNRLDRWVALVDGPNNEGPFRRLCIKDGGTAIWGVQLSDIAPTGPGGHMQPEAMLLVPQGVVWLGGGVIPTPRRLVRSGTCVRLTVAQHRKVITRLHAYFFGATHRPRLWTARTGKKWLSVAQSGDVVWVVAVTGDAADGGPTTTPVDGIGQVAVAGGVRPAQVGALGATDAYASAGDRQGIGAAFLEFFSEQPATS